MEENKEKDILLDNIQRQQVCAILRLGCSRRVAARYVGCAPSMIRATVARDEKFRHDIEQVEQFAEIEYMKNIREAAKKSQYWRAAAWVLERRNHEDYAARSAETITMDQVQQLLSQFAEIIVQEVPSATHRKKLLYLVEKLTAEYESDKKYTDTT